MLGGPAEKPTNKRGTDGDGDTLLDTLDYRQRARKLGCTTSVRSVPLQQFRSSESATASGGKGDADQSTGAIPQGIVYRLPLTALDYEAKYRLVSCAGVGANGGPPYEISLLDAKVTPVTVPDNDPRYTFVVDPKDMTSWFKQVKVAQLELREGLLKMVTYDAEDRTRQIVGQATKVALRFGTISTPGAPGLSGYGVTMSYDTTPPEPPVGCNKRAGAALATAESVKKKVIEAKGKVAAATVEFMKEPTAANGVKLEQEKEALGKHLASLGKVVEQQLSYVVRQRLYPSPESDQWQKSTQANSVTFTHVPEIPTELITQWLNVNIGGDRLKVARNQLQNEIGTKIFIDGPLQPATDAVPAYDGIYYRSPVQMTLSARHASTPSTALASSFAPFFQFGILAKIPMTNGVFQSNRYVVQFAADGTLTSFQYKEPKARLEEALTTAEETLGSLEDSQKTAIEAETALLNAEKARLDAEREVLEAKGALEAARDTSSP